MKDDGKDSVAFDAWMTLAVMQHLDWILLARTPQSRLRHDGETALQHCVVCMRHDTAMVS
jgi:hypothetical protein